MRKLFFLSAAVWVFTTRSFSQIQGDILDQKETGIPNAMIRAIDSATQTIDTVKSDKRGFFSFNKLKPGKYKIECTAAGFQTVLIKDILVKKEDIGLVEDDLYAGQRLDITLTPAKAAGK